jgi:putative hydrolase of the HAD superfamily
MLVRHLIFDLDNTLYPSTAQMDKGITQRMLEAVADYFHVSFEEGATLRLQRFSKFGTTLEWLRSEGLTDIESYFAKVHPENEADELCENPELRPLIQSIDIPKIILTNAPMEHAERVLKKLNVIDLFDDICDLRKCNLMGKPSEYSFTKALQMCGGTLEDTVFFDDLYKYTDGYRALGGTVVVVGDNPGRHYLAAGVGRETNGIEANDGVEANARAREVDTANEAGKPNVLYPNRTAALGPEFHIHNIFEAPNILKEISQM